VQRVSPEAFERSPATVGRRERGRRLISGGLALILALGGISVAWVALRPSHRERLQPSDQLELAPNAYTQAAVGESSVWFLSCDQCSDDEVTSGRARGRLLRVDPISRRVLATISIRDPGEMAIGEGAVWIANFATGTVTRIDAGTNRIVATIPLTLPFGVAPGDRAFLPLHVAVGEGAVWVDTARGAVARIDPRTNEVLTKVVATKGGDILGGMAIGEGSVWVDEGVEGVIRIDPRDGEVIARVPPIRSGRDLLLASFLAPGGGGVWATGAWARWSDRQGDLVATDPPHRVLMQIDPDTDRMVPMADLGSGGWPIAFGGGAVWIVSDQEVLQFDPSALRVTARVGLPPNSWLVPADDGAVPWLIGRDGSLKRIDSLVLEILPTLSESSTAFVPGTHREGDSIVMPVTFPDGTSAEILIPDDVDLAGMGAQPDVAYLWLDDPSPRFPISFYHGEPDPDLFAEDPPIDRFESRSGALIELWEADVEASDSEVPYWLVYRFGAWTILAPVSDRESADDIAHALDGHETNDGFVVIDIEAPLALSDEFGDGGGPQIAFGELDPRPYHVQTDTPRLVLLGPLPCTDETHTRKPSADYASKCLRGAIFASMYGDSQFLDALSKRLRARNVQVPS
jgi:virginiamycin B lyase